MNVSFVITSMPVGGAETLLVNLIRRLDRERFQPEVICLKERGPLGEVLAEEIPVHSGFLRSKYDGMVLPKLVSHFRRRQTQAVVTVGAGDKMFWGRLGAYFAGVPVIASALHSTGWPDGVGKLNRCLTKITDAFIAVAEPHGRFLVEFERFPESKVFVIPNGIDTQRFVPDIDARQRVADELQISADSKWIGIVAALRPEKNHSMFLQMVQRVIERHPNTHALIIGDGPERSRLETLRSELGLESRVHLLGNRSDTPQLLAALDVFTLTSHNEANPVSILEALSCEVPVVATQVGSVTETVRPQQTGFLAASEDVATFAEHVSTLLASPTLAKSLGANGRQLVQEIGSLDAMVAGYEQLWTTILAKKESRSRPKRLSAKETAPTPTCQWKTSPPSF
ncbi:MAG: glycosyltransferase [Pirellulales bacterium]